ncbi:MAG: sulfotransferase family protein [Nanoarchaeota archaeon]
MRARKVSMMLFSHSPLISFTAQGMLGLWPSHKLTLQPWNAGFRKIDKTTTVHCGIMKIFGVGLRKTGLASLDKALSILGYDLWVSPTALLTMDQGRLRLRVENRDIKDGLIDDPVPLFYKELDESYPGSRFILTTREMDSWVDSASNHFSLTRAILRILFREETEVQYIAQMYGAQAFDKALYVEAFRRHQQDVQAHFRGRQDLLEYPLGAGWEPLCGFLNVPTPPIDYPHENDRNTLRNRILSLI